MMKSKNKKGRMILRIDLEKAYDEWSFFKQTLKKFIFPESWVNLIMFCVSSCSIAMLVNGEPCEEFNPGRGLRQGDPIL